MSGYIYTQTYWMFILHPGCTETIGESRRATERHYIQQLEEKNIRRISQPAFELQTEHKMASKISSACQTDDVRIVCTRKEMVDKSTQTDPYVFLKYKYDSMVTLLTKLTSSFQTEDSQNHVSEGTEVKTEVKRVKRER